MTSQEWLAKARENEAKLKSLIAEWHPASTPTTSKEPVIITAPGAEAACQAVRDEIRGAVVPSDPPPVEQFSKALEAGDVHTINRMLNAAWFGVPESTSCWQIEGFREAVDLIEEPPDDLPDEPLDVV